MNRFNYYMYACVGILLVVLVLSPVNGQPDDVYPPVGGEIVPVSPLQILLPWVTLASIIAIFVAIILGTLRRRQL